MKYNFILYALTFVFALNYIVVFGQTGFESEDDLKKAATEFFENEKYEQALPLYSQLLSNYPKDPEYNYKFGACNLFVEEDKSLSLRYLEYAVARPNVDPEAFFYLGKAYHFNYRFEEAKAKYLDFKAKANSKAIEKHKVDAHIQMCENGMNLLKNITDLAVLDKKTLNRSDFFRTYDISSFGGKLIVKPEDFELAGDKKVDDPTVMYVNPQNERLYFSSYGDKGKSGKDIYYVQKLPDGTWGTPQNIGSTINTDFDEDYPFFNASTNTLYFSSKGHNSMGGYDVFKSNFNPSTGAWTKPINLDFAVNTPDDDFLYITDKSEKTAFFASTRTSSFGEVSVYKVMVERIPTDFSIIKGTFNSENTKAATITVENTKTGATEGVFKSNKDDGNYIITLPNGGSYKFVVETEESAVAYTGNVELPKLKNSKPLKQEISLVVENGYEKLIIKNLFDEEADGDFMLAADLLKRKASLDVNADESTIEEETPTEEVVEEVPEITNEEILKMAYEDAQNLETQANNIQKKVNESYALASDKNKEALKKSDEAKDLYRQAEESTMEDEKSQLKAQGDKLMQESKQLAKESVVAFTIAEKLEERYNAKKAQSDKALEFALQIDEAINADSVDEIAKILEQIEEIVSASPEESSDDLMSSLTAEFEESNKATEHQIQKAIKLKQQADELEKEITSVEGRAGNTKDKTEKELLFAEAEEMKVDLADLREKEKEAMELAKVMQRETDAVAQDANLIADVINDLNSYESDEELATLTKEEKTKLLDDVSTLNESIKEESSGTTNILDEESSDEIVDANSETDTELSSSEEIADNTDSQGNNESTESSSNNATDTNVSVLTTVDSDFIDEQSIPDDYSKYFEEKSAELANISDSKEKAAAEVELYAAWQQKLNNEIQEKQDKLNTITDDVEKQLLEEEIAEKQKQSSTNVEKLNQSASTYQDISGNDITNDLAAILAMAEMQTNELATSSTTETSSNESDESTASLVTVESNTAPIATVNSDFIDEQNIPTDYNSYFENKASELASMEEGEQKAASKVELYAAWQQKYNEDLDQKQDQLANTEDDVEKQLLEEEIKSIQQKSRSNANQLNNSVVDYSTISGNDLTKDVEALLADANLTINNVTGEITDSNEVESNNDSDGSSDANKTAVTLVSNEAPIDAVDTDFIDEKNIPSEYNAYFESKESDLSSMTSPEERATAEVELYAAWQQKINEDIQQKKAELASTSDDVEKQLLAEDIKVKEAQAQSNADKLNNSAVAYKTSTGVDLTSDITSLLAESNIEASSLANNGNESATSGNVNQEENTNESGTSEIAVVFDAPIAAVNSDFIDEQNIPANYNSYFENKVIEAESITDEEQKAAAKVELHAAWQKQLDGEIAQKENEVGQLPEGEANKTTLENEIIELKKQSLANAELLNENAQVYSNLSGTYITPDVAAITAVTSSYADDIAAAGGLASGNETDTTDSIDGNINEENSNESSSNTLQENQGTQQTQNESEDNTGTTASNEVDSSNADNSTENNNTSDIVGVETDSNTTTNNETTEVSVDSSGESNENATENLASSANNEAITTTEYTDDLDNTQLISAAMTNEVAAASTEVESLEKELASLNEEIEGTSDKEAKKILEAEVINVRSQLDEKKEELAFVEEKVEAVKAAEEFVRKNPSSDERKSQEQFDKSDQLAYEAVNLEKRAEALRDSAQTIDKKKDQDVVMQMADEVAQKAATKQRESEQAKSIGDEMVMAENQVIQLLGTSQTTGLADNNGSATTQDGSAVNRSSGDIILSEEDEEVIANSEEFKTYNALKEEANQMRAASKAQNDQALALESAAEKARKELQSISAELDNTDDSEEVNRLSNLTTDLENRLNGILAMLDSIKTAANQLNANASQKDQEAEQYLQSLDNESAGKIAAYQLKLDNERQLADNGTSGNNSSDTSNRNLSPEEEELTTISDNNGSDAGSDSESETESITGNNEIADNSIADDASSTVSADESIELDAIDTDNLTVEKAAEIAEKMPVKLTKEIFVKEEQLQSSPYSRSKPIPINVRHPEGLVFKVQIGAFRTPIPQDLFKGFAPITGERTESGLTRYTAGLFNNLNTAIGARDQIRGVGYNDAFVVAYYNGRRISIAEARTLLDGGTIDVPLASTPTTAITANGTNNNRGVANSNNVAGVDGLFYTVQVGVYRTEVPASTMYNISPLNREEMANGNIRYTSGVFNNLSDANVAKNSAVNIGITDAFVVAYYKGRKISVAEARTIIAENGNSILVNSIANGNSAASNTTTNQGVIEDEAGIYDKFLEDGPRNPIQFRIKLGTFTEKVPIEVAGVILALQDAGVNRVKESNGATTYIAASFNSLDKARTFKNKVDDDARIISQIIAYENGVEIGLDEAKEKSGQ